MFDEDYQGAGFEDVDFSLRLRRIRRNTVGMNLRNVVCLHHNRNQGRADAQGRDVEQ